MNSKTAVGKPQRAQRTQGRALGKRMLLIHQLIADACPTSRLSLCSLRSLRLNFSVTLALAQVLTVAASAADKAAPLSTFGKLPIKEITVFKDGHAFVDRKSTRLNSSHANIS